MILTFTMQIKAKRSRLCKINLKRIFWKSLVIWGKGWIQRRYKGLGEVSAVFWESFSNPQRTKFLWSFPDPGSCTISLPWAATMAEGIFQENLTHLKKALNTLLATLGWGVKTARVKCTPRRHQTTMLMLQANNFLITKLGFFLLTEGVKN